MKSLFSWLSVAAIAAALSGCSTCYTEGYQSVYDSHGFRATGMEEDPRLSVYTIDDLRFHPIDESPDLLRPTLGLSRHYPPAPVVPEN